MEFIDIYFKKYGIFNVQIINYLTKFNIQIQNSLNEESKSIFQNQLLLQKIISVIKYKNILDTYTFHKNIIISSIITDDSHINKKKKINILKRKISERRLRDICSRLTNFAGTVALGTFYKLCKFQNDR